MRQFIVKLAHYLHVQLFLWHGLRRRRKRLNCMWVHGIRSAISSTSLAYYSTLYNCQLGVLIFKRDLHQIQAAFFHDTLIVLMSASPKRSEMWWDYIQNTSAWLTGWGVGSVRVKWSSILHLFYCNFSSVKQLFCLKNGISRNYL